MVNANNTKSTSPNDMHEANNVGGGYPKDNNIIFLLKVHSRNAGKWGGSILMSPLIQRWSTPCGTECTLPDSQEWDKQMEGGGWKEIEKKNRRNKRRELKFLWVIAYDLEIVPYKFQVNRTSRFAATSDRLNPTLAASGSAPSCSRKMKLTSKCVEFAGLSSL